jgi:AraC-like DNA-binding protein
MDAMSDLLKTIQLSASTYIFEGGQGHWNMQIQYRPQGIFHILVSGSCYLREGGHADAIALQSGDVVAFPTGGLHWLSDGPEGQKMEAVNAVKVPGDDGLMLLKAGDITAKPVVVNAAETGIQVGELRHSMEQPGSDPEIAHASDSGETILLSGTLSYDSSIDHPFLKSLPCFIHASTAGSRHNHGLKKLLDLLIETCRESYPGSSLATDRLIEILFVQLLRAHTSGKRQADGYLAALSDRHIGLALNLIHTEKNAKWTVETLCSAAAMSRTTFTQRFSELVGSTPKIYLTNTRLMKARTKLQRTNQSLLSIAEEAGYSSESAFGKAFKKHFNKTPGELRRG